MMMTVMGDESGLDEGDGLGVDEGEIVDNSMEKSYSRNNGYKHYCKCLLTLFIAFI